MTREDPIVIVSAVRTPMGGFLGDFKDVNAATAWATARCSTTCSSTASKTPTTRAA